MMLEAHQIMPHDLTVGSALARVLTGGNTSPTIRMTEQQLLDIEREQFLALCGEQKPARPDAQRKTIAKCRSTT